MNCRDKEIEQLGRKRERVEILNRLSEEIKTLIQTRDQFPPGSEKNAQDRCLVRDRSETNVEDVVATYTICGRMSACSTEYLGSWWTLKTRVPLDKLVETVEYYKRTWRYVSVRIEQCSDGLRKRKKKTISN